MKLCLSEMQQKAVKHKDGSMLVLAGPGSGKTRVITCRVQYLIEKHGISPNEVLVVTFTRAAAKEMKERFLGLTGMSQTTVSFGTFHSVFFGILKHAYGLKGDQIIRQEQQYEYLHEIVRRLCLKIEDESEFFSELLGEISRLKNQRQPLEAYQAVCCEPDEFRMVYKHYEERLKRAGLLDFDDMMVYCYELLSERPDILQAWQKRYRYILVDEFQDINSLQYDIVRMLAGRTPNLFVVGDDDQSIYGFRGSNPEFMLKFSQDYPGTKMLRLDVNYRSTPEIVNHSQCLIQQNERRFKKSLVSDHPAGPPVVSHVFENYEEQTDCIADKIRIYKENGGKLSDVAILFRTNVQAAGFVEKLMERNISFQMKDRLPNIYEHWIAQHISAYIRMARGSRTRMDFLKIMNRPKRYIGREVLETETVCFEELYKWYDDKQYIVERLEKLEYDLKMISRMKPFSAIHYIRHVVGYEEYLKEYAEYRGIKCEEYLEIYEEIQEQSRRFTTFDEWFSYVEEYGKELKKQAANGLIDGSGVVLSTMHSSKGLEYRIVFVADANEGITPYKKAMLPEELEEERRLFYVAMTRAKELLYLFAVKERYGKKQDVSRFLYETGTLDRERKLEQLSKK